MKKHSLGTRLFSLLLTLTLCLTALPLQVLAKEPADGGAASAAPEAPDKASGAPEAAPEDADETDPYVLDPLRPGLLTAALDGAAYSRGQWLRELERVFGLTADEDAYPDVYYPDVEASEYFDAVMTAVVHGLSDVEPGDPFGPEDPLTRAFAAHTLNFLLGLQPRGEGGYTFSDSGETEYPDDAQAVVDAGWLELADGKFLPGQAVTETEARAMLEGARAELEKRDPAPVSRYRFADYVAVLPDDAYAGADESSSEFLLSSYDGVEPGAVFAVMYQDLALVYRAETVWEREDGLLAVTVSDAPDGAVLEANFSGSVTPELNFEPEGETVTLRDRSGQPVTFGAARGIETGDGYIKGYIPITLGNGVTGSLSVDLGNVDIVSQSGGRIGLAMTGSLTVTSTVKFDLADSGKETELPLGTVKIGPCGAFGSISLSVNLDMRAKLSYAYSGPLRLGFYYEDGAVQRDVSFNSAKPTISADGTASALLVLKGTLKAPAIAEATLTASVGPVLNGSAVTHASGTPKTCATISGYLKAAVRLTPKVYILDLVGKPLKPRTWDLFTEENSPIRVYEHREDGRTVYACTRGNQSGGSGSYKPPKYITPGNSRIYASGNSSGSSTWSGGGSAEPVVIWTTEPNENGGVTVTGYQGGASVLNIPETIDGETVTAIGERAFYGGYNNDKPGMNLRVVTIPDTVMKIGNYAFMNCRNLRTVQFGDSVTEIGTGCFRGCTSLGRIELPKTLTKLCYESFGECTSLENVHIPASLTEVEFNISGPFRNCSSLDQIAFGKGISVLPQCLFEDCIGLTHIEIPDTVTTIDRNVFKNCSNLQSVQFGECLTEIGNNAFDGCSALTDLLLPESLSKLGAGCFSECTSLKHVYIPANLAEVEFSIFGPFEYCSSLDSVTFGKDITQIPGRLFYNCTGLTHMEIPETVSTIGWYAFQGCENLAQITIPDSVTDIGAYTFDRSGLVTVTIPNSITSYGDHIFENCKKLTAAVLSKTALNVPHNMFSGCTSLKTVALPDGMTAIRYSTFENCVSLENLNFLPDSVTTIEWEAFEGCTGLKTVNLSDSISELGDRAFYGCTSLTSFQAGGGLKAIGDSCLRDCAALTGIKLNRGLREIGSYAFQNCAALEEIALPDTVSHMGDYIFQKDAKLTRVTLSKGLAEIPSYAFANCTALKRLDIPQSVTAVRDHAFYQDTALKTFTIPRSVETIESNAFSYPTSTTVYGVPGSYAETFAKWKEFIPIAVVPVTGLALDRTELTLTEGGSQTLTASVLPGNASNKTVLWSASNASAAEVSPDGVVIAKKAGKATVTAKTADGGYTASCTVTVTAAPGKPDQPGPSGNTMGPNNELAWTRTGRTLTVTGPVSAAEPLWVAAYDQNGRLLSVSPVTASGGSVSLPGGAASSRLIWTDGGRTPKCASVSVSMK